MTVLLAIRGLVYRIAQLKCKCGAQLQKMQLRIAESIKFLMPTEIAAVCLRYSLHVQVEYLVMRFTQRILNEFLWQY